MNQKKIIQVLVSSGIVGSLSLMAACGGSSGNSSSAGTSQTAATGVVNMSITDGPSDTFNHVWVTVKSIAFHTDSNAVWSSSDATWQTTTLSSPITIDLAALNNGAMNNLFANITLPVGSYKQIRFFMTGDTDALTSSAQGTIDNEVTPKSLQWNDQVEYTNGIGNIADAPLEISNLIQGLQLVGTFNVTAGGTLNLVTDFNLEKIITPYYQYANPTAGSSYQGFTLKGDLRYFDLTNSGGIAGYIGNTSAANAVCEPTVASPCIGAPFHLFVHAEAVSADGTRYEAIRSTSVNPVTGQFTVAPLPLTDNKGNSLTYDIVIRGRQMQTMLISGVTPTGSFTGPTLSGAAVLSSQTNPLAATYAAEYSAQLSVPLAPLTNGHIVFEQTPCQSSLATCTTGVLPHEIRWADTNPFTGDIKSGDRAGLAPWAQNFNLVTSGLLTAKYVVPVTAATAPSTALTFSPVGNTEGAGNYSVVADEKAYYNFSSPNLLNWTSPATTETVNLINLPTLISTVQNGTVNGTVSVATAGKYVTGQLIVARSGQTVTAQDISTNLITAGNFNFTVTGLGAGSATTEVGGAYYYAYLRLFNSAGKRTIVSLPGFIDLRFTNSVSGLNVSI